MEEIIDFSDERQKQWCIHCHVQLALVPTNEDHVPTKSLLLKPRPHHLPKVIICRSCNNNFSFDEQYTVSFLSCVLTGSSDPAAQHNKSAASALSGSPALRTRIESARTEYKNLAGETKILWQPERERIHRVILKNARGHAYFEIGEPLLNDPISVVAVPLQSLSLSEQQTFEACEGDAVFPEVGSRMMERIFSGLDMLRSWVVVQEGIYRYAVFQREDQIFVRSIIYEYLASEVIWDN